MKRVIYLLLLGLLSIGCGASTAPEEVKGQSESYSPEIIREDFRQLYHTLQAAHYNLFVNTPKKTYDELFESTLASINGPMTLLEVKVLFQRFVARSHIAHANIAFPGEAFNAYREAGGKIFPLFIRIVDGKAYVNENYTGNEQIELGDQLIAINRHSIADWVQRLSRHFSADNAIMANAFLELRLPAYLWLEIGAIDRFQIQLRKSNGKSIQLDIDSVTREQMRSVAVKQAKTFELDFDSREARMLNKEVAYLRPGPFYNNQQGAENIWDNRVFRQFIDESFDSFILSDAKALIIDLRNNPGGDNSFSDPLISWFADKPFRFASDFRVKVSQQAIDANLERLKVSADDTESVSHQYAREYASHKLGEVFSIEFPLAKPRAETQFDGKVFMLVNRHSYSNTVSVAAIGQDYQFATILGEATSDLATTYGAMERFNLKNTGIEVGFPKAHIIRPNGDEKPAGVTPDIEIATPIIPSGSDVVLARAQDIVNQKMISQPKK